MKNPIVLLTPQLEHYIKGLFNYMPKEVKLVLLEKTIKNTSLTNLSSIRGSKTRALKKVLNKSALLHSIPYRFLILLKKINIIHAQSSILGYPLRNTGRPLLITEHGCPNPDIVPKWRKHIHIREKLSLKKLYEIGIPIVTISNYSSQMLRKIHGVKVKKVIYHGVLPIFQPKKATDRSPNEEYVVTWVSRMITTKKPIIFLDAIKLLKEKGYRIKGLMRGSGPIKPYIKTLLKQKSINYIKMVKRIPFNKMPQLYRSSDLFVHTNPIEPFGLALLEAMASGLPVITPSTGGANEIAKYAGLRFEPDNSRDLAEKISILLENEEELYRQRELSIKRSKEFSWKKASREYCELYKKLL